MDLDRKVLDAISELRDIEDVKYSDIPDMDMYMEQLLFFLNQKLEPHKRDTNEKILTKPMINNYTKSQVLLPPKNKKYNKEHIVLLVLVFQLKNIFSINDIQHLFGPMLKDMSTSEDDLMPLKDIYASYLELKNNYWDELSSHLTEIIDFIKKKTDFIEPDNNRKTAELFLLVMHLTAQANAAKRIAEILIDMYFTDENASDGTTLDVG